MAIADTCIKEQKEKRLQEDTDAEQTDTDTGKSDTYSLEKDLEQILNDKENKSLSKEDNIKARVNAFYSLCTKHRRQKDYNKFKTLLNDDWCKDEIGKEEIFKIMQAYYRIQETAYDFKPKDALKKWKNEIDPIYKRLPAFTQIYTETIALQCEMTNEEDTKLLDEAKELIDKAIKMREYPKFYSTRGRIFACKGDFDEGIIDVRKAITIEDSSRKDYVARLNEYQSLISRFQRQKDEKELREQAEAIKMELDKSKMDYIGILGFFSGIMALIIGTINAAGKNRSMIDSIQLLICIAGMIIISFGSLNLILVRKEDKVKKSRTYKYSEWTLIIIGIFVFLLSFGARMLYLYLKANNWI